MGGNGKHKWKISFHLPSSIVKTSNKSKQPPMDFICPISRSLMADPVVVSSGQTFERVSVQVCRDLGLNPVLDDGSNPDFTAVIPNLALRSTILSWCNKSGVEHPQPPDYSSVQKIVRTSLAMNGNGQNSGPQIRVSERELLKGVAENPPVIFSHAATELGLRVNHFSSSSSEESVIVAASPARPLPFTTRPACYSSSSSSSFEIMENEIQSGHPTTNHSSSCSEEEEFAAKLTKSEIFEQEEAVISLRKITRTREDLRASLCSDRILFAFQSLIASRYAAVQTNAVAALVNLSLENSNKVKIVRSGLVPLLIDVLKGGSNESQEHAAGALFSLALEDQNQMAIAVLGALPPLMHALRSESERTRHDAALALYHLTFVTSNRVKLVKLNAVVTLVGMVKLRNMANLAVLILCNLAACAEGRAAMLDANAVEILVGMLRRGSEVDSEATTENCVAALYALSQGSMRFKGLAKEARAVEALREIEERGSERAREKARRTLQMLRGREEMEEGDWQRFLESGGLTRIRHPAGGGGGAGANYSSDF